MLYALYSEGFRLGGQNSQRAAADGRGTGDYEPDHLENYELGIKTQWLDNRLLLNVSAFFMEWSDIQLHFGGTDSDNRRPWWVEGNFNGGKAEQKGIEFNGEWHATDRLNFEWSGFIADPEFSEDTFVPNRTRSTSRRAGPCRTRRRRSTGPRSSTRSRISCRCTGDFWTRFSYTYRARSGTASTDIEDFDSWRPTDRDDSRSSCCPAWKSGTFQFGVRATTAGTPHSSFATCSTTTASTG